MSMIQLFWCSAVFLATWNQNICCVSHMPQFKVLLNIMFTPIMEG
jgi:hypothetical protein